MFEIRRVFVEDKKLGDILRAMDGLVVGEGPLAIPVRAAKVQGKKIVSTQPVQGAALFEQVMFYIINQGWTKLDSYQLQEAYKTVGGGGKNANSLLQKLKDIKFLKQIAGPKRGGGLRTYSVSTKVPTGE